MVADIYRVAYNWVVNIGLLYGYNMFPTHPVVAIWNVYKASHPNKNDNKQSNAANCMEMPWMGSVTIAFCGW